MNHTSESLKLPPPRVQGGHYTGTAAAMPSTLAAELTHALKALWTLYAGVSPTDAHTQIDGNIVTCVLVDGVSDFNRFTDMALGSSAHAVGATYADYKLEAVSEVTRLTRQRVISFLSSHDQDTDVATEIFTLEASSGRGAPPASRRPGHRFTRK